MRTRSGHPSRLGPQPAIVLPSGGSASRNVIAVGPVDAPGMAVVRGSGVAGGWPWASARASNGSITAAVAAGGQPENDQQRQGSHRVTPFRPPQFVAARAPRPARVAGRAWKAV